MKERSEGFFKIAPFTMHTKNIWFWQPIFPLNTQKLLVFSLITGHSVHEVHGFEFPAKTIFSNNLKTIDWRAVYYVYLSLAKLFWPKKCTKSIYTIDNF